MGAFFSKEREFMFISQWDQVSRIIRSLVTKFEYAEKIKLCSEILSIAMPFEFAIKLHSRFWDMRRNIVDEDFIKIEQHKDIAEPLVSRFLELNQTADFFMVLSEEAIWSIFLRFTEMEIQQQVRDILSAKLQEHNTNALKIIRTFTPSHYNTLRG